MMCNSTISDYDYVIQSLRWDIYSIIILFIVELLKCMIFKNDNLNSKIVLQLSFYRDGTNNN